MNYYYDGEIDLHIINIIQLIIKSRRYSIIENEVLKIVVIYI